MNPRSNQYIKELHSYIESVPFGDIDIHIKRVDKKTVQINTVSEETLRYVDNAEALRDLIGMISRLAEAGFSGQSHIKLDMKDGQIRLIGIFDQKETKYS